MFSAGSRLVATLGLLLATLVAAPSAQAASKPAAPTSVKSSPGYYSVAVSWKKSSRATSYSVCLMTNGKTSKCRHTSKRVTGTSVKFVGILPTSGRDYYVRVRAHNGAGTTQSSKTSFDLVPDPRPAVPTGVTRTVSGSSAKVSWKAASKAKGYSVCLMTSGTTTSCARTASTTATSATFTGLTPTGGRDFYYYVRSVAGSHVSPWSAKGSFDLPVAAVAKPSAAASSAGVLVRWAAAANAGSYEVRVSSDEKQTVRAVTHAASGTELNLTGLAGGTHYVAVRGRNDDVSAAWSPVTSVVVNGPAPAETAATDLSVMTYNVCGQNKCVTSSNGMKPWTTRKSLAGSLVQSIGADIVSTQESHATDTRLGDVLPGYATAVSSKSKTLFYKTAVAEVVRSGAMTLDSKRSRYGVWAEFRVKKTGARVIVVDPHLEPGKGKTLDDVRTTQTATLLAETKKINTAGLPVVWAGDFNSNASNADQKKYKGGYDAPRRSFMAAGHADAKDEVAAAQRVNVSFNSANQAKNPPLKHGHHVDQIFVDPQLVVLAWKMVPRLSGSSYTTPFASDHNPIVVTVRIPAS